MIAQPVEQIQADIIEDIGATPALSYTDPAGNVFNITNNTSKRAKWRLETFVVASVINSLEQLIDINQASNEALILAAIPPTANWLAQQISNFQYSELNPQFVVLGDNMIYAYPVVDPTLQIISRRNVATTNNNQALIKYAIQEPPTAGTASQTSALQDYVNTIGTPGVKYVVSTALADKLMIGATINYQGQYAAIIQNSVITALTNFLTSLSSFANFDGTVKVSDIENIIRAVPGVVDCVLNNVQARADTTPLSSAGYLVQNNTWLSRLWPTVAGYIIQETTTGFTFADTLTFIAQ